MTNRGGLAAPLLLAVVLALILYVSLFPFRFDAGPFRLSDALRALHWARASRGDMFNNLLLYLPLGFTLSLWLAPRLGRSRSVLLATLAGFALSLSMELLQSTIALRVASLRDLSLNTLGSATGAVAGAAWQLIGARLLPGNPSATRARNIAWAVIALWLLARLWPLLPDIGLRQLKQAVRPLLEPSLGLRAVAAWLIGWLVVAQAVFHVVKRQRAAEALLLVIAAVLIGRAVTTGNALVAAEMTALVLMLPVLILFSRLDERWRCGVLALAVAAALGWHAFGRAVLGDAPFGAPARMIPQLIAGGAHEPASLLLRAFGCLALGWLLLTAGLRSRWAAVILVMWVAVLCLWQTPRLPLRFDWTDFALAVAAGLAIVRWTSALQRKNR